MKNKNYLPKLNKINISSNKKWVMLSNMDQTKNEKKNS